MRVTTAYPVYVNNKRVAGSNDWLYAGDTPVASPYDVPNAPIKGIDLEKVKGYVKQGAEFGKSSGIFDMIGNALGLKKKQKPSATPVPVSTAPMEKKGMSTTTMLMIGGGVVVAGILAYLVLKPKSKATSKA
tara:strand:- start:52 stop:447 length:396 start_codon:yes stop_codon:yes gene_type:complete